MPPGVSVCLYTVLLGATRYDSSRPVFSISSSSAVMWMCIIR